ncbi:MAG: SDR family NAD(P)-dependent oxidoreductase [Pseudomonadota bacterium]
MQISFKGRIALVTGATRGIGKQIADDMGRLGAELILTGTNPEEIAKLNQAGRRRKSPRHWHAVDFMNAESVKKFFREIEVYDRIDICINNAGINRINPIDEIQETDWLDVLRVNLDAPFLVTRAVSRVMKKHSYGRIVNIGSIFGVISKEKRAAYSVTKFGVRGLTAATALDLAKYNILVNTVSPGFVSTDLTRRILGEKGMQEMALKVPLGRLASPDEISRVVLFIVSDLNTYMTGQNIIVDGGVVNA